MIPCKLKSATVALVVISFLLLLVPKPAQACGPFFTDAIFVFEKHPDFPLERFARGDMGVLKSSYARSYLVAAYRNLIGEKLSESEVKALNSLWDDRINLNEDYASEDWVKRWNDARAKVTGAGAAPDIQVYRNREKPHEYEAYLNCQQDAFENAVATLADRVKRFGNDSAEAREWLKAQDVVFSNCGGGSQIPEATTSQDQLLRADRAYQIAAANFYAAHFDDAAKQFDAIAQDASSPWRDVAGYLAARAELRKGSLADKEDEGAPALGEAEGRLNAILNDKSLSRSHHAATRLLNLTRLRLHPEDKVNELAAIIVKKDRTDDFKQAVWDYTVLLDKFVGEDEVKIETVPEALKKNDLTDWVLTFQDLKENAAKHAIDRWHETKSVAWLVSALSKASSQTSEAADMIEAAARVNPSSSAFPSLVFHRARLLMESNRAGEARALLDRTLTENMESLPPSAVNALTSQRMMLAANLSEFLTTAQRKPAGFSDNVDDREIPSDEKDSVTITNGAKLFFDSDAAYAFNNLMPVSMIDAAAQSKVLAANLHRDVTQAAFMRAALLDNAKTANSVAAQLIGVYPQLAELVASYQKAATPDARKFAAAYMALKFPGLRPYVSVGIGRYTDVGEMDDYRDNWWCAQSPTTSKIDYSGGDETEGAKKPAMPVPEFLKSTEAQASREAAALQAFGAGPNYLCQTVINWANRNPTDARVPEALHLAVKSTRYGCTDKDSGRWSKAAFDLLHRKYPNTSWAKDTKYWFKG
jgi:hypothetical protein